MDYVNIGGKLFFGLIALLVVSRLLGKKELSQLTPFDFIYSVVLGGLLEESVYDDQVSWTQIWFAVAVWGVMLYAIEKLSQNYDKVRVFLKGESSILIQDGELNIKELNKNHLEMEQLRIMLRKNGVFSLREVRDLYLEPGGAISIKKYAEMDNVTPKMLDLQTHDEGLNFLLLDEGEINEGILNYLGKSKEWLYDELQKEGYSNMKDIVYAEWSAKEGFFIKTYNKKEESVSKGN